MGALQGPLKWGFFGAGKITHDFVTVLRSLPPTNHIPFGVAARDHERAKTFAESHGIKKSFQSYRQLAEDPEIDIIYIGTVNSEHYSQAKLAVENSKHVLVEKAICVNTRECQDLIDTARKKGVFLMEGFWTTFFPATRKLFSEIENGSIGNIVCITLEVGRNSGELERFRRKDLGGGILLNYGVYGIMLTYLLLGPPDDILATGHLSAEGGIDETVTLTLSYRKKGCISNIIMSSKVHGLPCELRVNGTKGNAQLPYPFWAPHKCETPNGTFTYELPNLGSMSNEKLNYPCANGFVYEIEEVERCIRQGLRECPFVPLEASLAVMRIADEARRQLGVIFPQDES